MIKKNNIFIVFLLLSFCQGALSQEREILKEVNSIAEGMFESVNNRDYDAMLEMTHPKAFEIESKEDMKNALKSMFEGNEDFSIDVPKLEPNYKLSDVYSVKENNLDYVFVSYDMQMKMTFHKQEFDEEEKKLMTNMMLLKGIAIDFESNSTFNMNINPITIILRDDYTNNNWVMLNYDPDSPLFYKIAPVSLLETVKEYKQNLMLESEKESKD